jgi:hypothetical protein
LNITLLNINKTTATAKNGKPYQIAELAYKNNTYGGAIEGFKVTSYMKGFADISAAQIGDTLDITVEKQNGFNQWVSATKAIPGVTPAPSKSEPKPNAAGNGFNQPAPKVAQGAFGRDFETREERAKKQVYIVRQSAISSAIAALSVGGKSALKSHDILAFAKELEHYVFETAKVDDVPPLNPEFHVGDEPDLD